MKTQIENISFTKGNSFGIRINLKTNIGDIKEVYFTVKDKSGKVVLNKK